MWERARLQISCQLMRSNLAGPPRRRRIPETCYHSFGSQKGTTMRWYHYVAYFFGGAFLANTLPHVANACPRIRKVPRGAVKRRSRKPTHDANAAQFALMMERNAR